MYFHTQTGKKDVTSFATVATFFIDKFPAAFGASATYTTSKGVSSEDAYVRMDIAQSVEYEFEEGFEQHAESFVDFEKNVLKSFKQGSESACAVFLLELLLEMKHKVLELPTSIRTADCTIQRFYLLLLPLLNLAEAGDYDGAKNLTERFVSLLCDDSEYTLKIKVDCIVQLFNSVHTNTGIKSSALIRLVQLCHKEGCFDNIVMRAKSIVKDSEEWSLTVEERRQLYRCVATVLDQEGHFSSAFHVMYSCLKLYQATDNLVGTEQDARRCVILAMKAVDVINFAELVLLPAIKQLTATQTQVFSLLNLFTSATAQEFKIKMAEYADLMTTEGLTESELLVKKSYVIICSFESGKTNYSYSELSQSLNMDKEDIELWAIEAIQNKIIDAKIDQLNEMIVIKNHMLREIKMKEWQAIQLKIRAWKERFVRVKTVLAAANQATANVPAITEAAAV